MMIYIKFHPGYEITDRRTDRQIGFYYIDCKFFATHSESYKQLESIGVKGWLLKAKHSAGPKKQQVSKHIQECNPFTASAMKKSNELRIGWTQHKKLHF